MFLDAFDNNPHNCNVRQRHNRLFKAILFIFGSWWSIAIHTIVFISIIFVFKDMLLFTTIVSIEAIYIGIFILMAESREEAEKERREMERRSKDRELVKEDVILTTNVSEEIIALKQMQSEMNEILKRLDLNNTQSNTTTTP